MCFLKVFDFIEYRAFVRSQIEEHKGVRGYQGMLANAAGCQPSFFSQVLSSHIHLTPDHAANLASFWKFNEDELEYFVSLVMFERAASPELRHMLKERLEKLRIANSDLSKRFMKERLTDKEHEGVYYSAWFFAAIHICLAVPGLQSPKAISARLGLPLDLVKSCLQTLSQIGLAVEEKNSWKTTHKSIHLPRHSPFAKTNMMAWRHKAIERAQIAIEDGMHYTAIHALAKKDILRLMELLKEYIEKSRAIVEPSPEEEVICFTCDLFKV